MDKWDVFDFDGTVYDGDCSIDFMLFVFRKNKKLWWLWPKYILFTFLYFCHFISSSKYKKIFFSFLKYIEDRENIVGAFWKEKEKKIKPFFLEILKESKPLCIVSASPEFLLKPYFKSFKNVTVIGTIMDINTGHIEGKNCKGIEKINRLKNIKKTKKIASFYTDSLTDLPVTEIAEKSYLVEKDQIRPFNQEELLHKKQNRRTFFLFLAFFAFYVILGILLSYHHDFSKAYNLLFDSDSPRVIEDMSDIFGNHYRLKVHPLFVLLIQPFILLLSGLTIHKTLAIIIFLSMISAFSVSLLYKFASLCKVEEKIKLVFVCIFGFAFSNMIFTAGIELYNIAALFLLALWYHVVKIMQKEKCTKGDGVFLIILGVLTASITITNYVVFLIGCFVLLLSKKISFKKIFFINICVGIILIGLSFFQNLVWHNTPLITDFSNNYTEENNYMETTITFNQIKKVVREDYIHSLVGSNVHLQEEDTYSMLVFSKLSVLSLILGLVFYGTIFYFVIRNGKKHLLMNIGLVGALLFNSLLHTIYGNTSAFLYALHFLYLPFLLFFVNYQKPEKKEKHYFLLYGFLLFLCIEFLNNLYQFKSVLYFVSTVTEPNYFKAHFSLFLLFFLILGIILVCYILCAIIYMALKGLFTKNSKGKYIIGGLASLLILKCIFIGLETIPVYQKIGSKRIGDTSLQNIEVKSIGSSLKKTFQKEYQSYLTYAKEYKKFVQKYDATIVYTLGNSDYYFFGLGNRRKLLYKEGTLRDLETNEIVQKWDVKEELVIPNLYTVILETKEGSMIKLHEDEKGVSIEENGKKDKIEGTTSKISLETFAGQTYQNIKKVLYSEILFNIKDSKPIPNILVYDAVWYRDAAMAAMVLNRTHNTDLIEDFISEIDELYDKQNGEEELDNLGEILYILSTSHNKHDDLVEKIVLEAEKKAQENQDGYYLKGHTDGQPHPVYQNAWYRFGLESLHKKTKIKSQKMEDSYASLTWWYPNKESIVQASNESSDFPYLSWAQYHTVKTGKLFVSHRLYPLSYESHAGKAKYERLSILDDTYAENKVSPTHIWTASEMLLFLLDETND